jgi:hypothetical protein
MLMQLRYWTSVWSQELDVGLWLLLMNLSLKVSGLFWEQSIGQLANYIMLYKRQLSAKHEETH